MDEVNVRNLLEDEIATEFEDLGSLEAGSKEKSTAIENLVKLYRLKIDDDKNTWEFNEKYDQRIAENERHQLDGQLKEKQIDGDSELRERELEIKKEQMKEQSKDRWFNLGIQVGTVLIGIIAYDRWFKRGLKFEETGSITAPMTKNLLSRMLPKK